MLRSQNPKRHTVLALASLLLLIQAAEATQVFKLAKHTGDGSWKGREGYYEWTRSMGIVCKCCDGATCTPASSSAAAAACSSLRCLPWKFHF